MKYVASLFFLILSLPLFAGKSITSTSDRTKVFEQHKVKPSRKALGTVIALRPSETFQSMDGFGAAITGSSCYNLMQMTPANRKAFLERTFSPSNGLGFSYVRVSIGCSDFSLNEFTCCDTPGIENFSLTREDMEYVIPVLREILAINPELLILGSPWTCPRWMKVNNLEERLVEDMREVALGTVLGGCRAVIVWNLMLDTERGPYRPGGCSVCYGAVDIDRNDWQTITLNSHYYIIGHMASVVRPGAVRIGTTTLPETSSLMYAAFRNPDGTTAFVVLNQGEQQQTVSVKTPAGRYVNLEVPARAVCSALW